MIFLISLYSITQCSWNDTLNWLIKWEKILLSLSFFTFKYHFLLKNVQWINMVQIISLSQQLQLTSICPCPLQLIKNSRLKKCLQRLVNHMERPNLAKSWHFIDLSLKVSDKQLMLLQCMQAFPFFSFVVFN